MKIIIKVKNLELTDALENFIEGKIGALKKFIDILKEDANVSGKTLAEVFVEIEQETKHHRKGEIFGCKLELTLPGRNLVVQSNSDDLYKAITDAQRELEGAIKKYKIKRVDRNRRTQKKFKKEINL